MSQVQVLLAIGLVSLIIIPTTVFFVIRGMGILKSIGIAMLLLFAAMQFSHDNVDAAESVNCYDYITQDDIWADDETQFWYVLVEDWVIENPTDGVLVTFGGCVLSLINQIEVFGKTGFVVLVNEGWVPSRSRTIDRRLAEAMADMDIADAEYGFDMEEAAWLAGNRETGSPD